MPFDSIDLDDRRFEDLVKLAQARARESCPDWTDFSPGDPGTVLLELFAFLTENVIYRLNRLPEKAYLEFLNLLGVRVQPPAAATVEVTFERKDAERALEIPCGTRLLATRRQGSEPIVFSIGDDVKMAAGQMQATARAHHCEWIQAELAGHGTGAGGQRLRVARPPIVAPTGDRLDLVVGVEAHADEVDAQTPVIRHGEKIFRIWSEREGFVDLGTERCAYVCDRLSGTLIFAPVAQMREENGTLALRPSALAEVPAQGREIRVWYSTGGGSAGNVAAGAVSKLASPIAGATLEVTNLRPATGGRDAESLANARIRGPQELHSLRRAVTARDFEMHALRVGGVNRACASTMFNLWKYAPRGTVELVCMPNVPESEYPEGRVTREMISKYASAEALERVRAELDLRRPLGTRLVTRWGHCKQVRVAARVVVLREEDPSAVRKRLLQELYDTITPLDRVLPDGRVRPGWRFGRPLNAYDVYRILSSEPGVHSVEPVKLCVDEVPSEQVSALSVDSYQPGTWYAGVRSAVYRTLNDGDGWEQIALLPEGVTVRHLQAYPREAAGHIRRAGLLAAIGELAEGKSRVYLSRDCGESWTEIGARPEFRIRDFAWTDRDGEPVLLLATEKGLYSLAITEDADPTPILVDAGNVGLGCVAVAVSTDLWGNTCVAVAAEARGGVYLSTEGGKPKTFRRIGLEDENITLLTVQHDGADRYLWAGKDAVGDEPGKGCSRWQLPQSPKGWESFDHGWAAGGCQGLAFLNGEVLAATRRHGVLRMNLHAPSPQWSAPNVESGLPMQALGRMRAVTLLAASSREGTGAGNRIRVMAAGAAGVYRSTDDGAHFELCSQTEFRDRVTLPDTWLFCSDVHDIEVSHDATRRD